MNYETVDKRMSTAAAAPQQLVAEVPGSKPHSGMYFLCPVCARVGPVTDAPDDWAVCARVGSVTDTLEEWAVCWSLLNCDESIRPSYNGGPGGVNWADHASVMNHRKAKHAQL
jgi:hypothetical protein